MPSVFKVWIHIEEIDEEEDLYKDMGEPTSLAEFEFYPNAVEFADKLCDVFQKVRYEYGEED